MLDLTGRVLKTNEMTSNVDLINQLSAEVWKGTTWTIQSHQIVVCDINVSQLLVTHARSPQVAMKVMRPLLFLDREIKEQSSQVNDLTSQIKCVFHNLSSVSCGK
jgi:hypothetical protein